jgi:hypothetical protein
MQVSIRNISQQINLPTTSIVPPQNNFYPKNLLSSKRKSIIAVTHITDFAKHAGRIIEIATRKIL